jgi:hypothetical protein
MGKRLWYHPAVCITLGLVSSINLATAQTQQSPDAVSEQLSSTSSGDAIVTYLPEFFQRYQPNTALEMVQQVPGFTINNGGSGRGFGGAAGNISDPGPYFDQPGFANRTYPCCGKGHKITGAARSG